VKVPKTVIVVDGAKALVVRYDWVRCCVVKPVGASVRSLATRRRGKDCVFDDCYLVDPASSHMLVSKIKPCMSQYLL
jgi:hypothetical protein